jgi:3-oxoadipate enol-lactonase
VSYLEIPGARLYYEVAGQGPPVLLLHAGVAHLRMWDEQVAAWRDRFRVICYDQRGFGRTTGDDVAFSNRDDLRRLLDHLRVERAALVGASRGGAISIDFSLEQPERVSALVVVGSGLGGFEGPGDGIDWDAMEALYRARAWEELVEREVQIWTDGVGQPPTRVSPSVRQRMTEMGLQNYRAEQPAEQAQPLAPPAAGRLPEINVPTLVMWGTLDTPGVIAAGQKIAAEVAGARSHVFEGVAHMVNLERPAELNRLVGEFLADSGGAA